MPRFHPKYAGWPDAVLPVQNSVCFGSNLDMLSLHSNKHQNLWNSLVIMVMAWLGPTFHEIRRSVGGENHRYRPPTHTPLHLSRSASRQVPSLRVSLAPNTMEKHLSVEIGSTKCSYTSASCTQRAPTKSLSATHSVKPLERPWWRKLHTNSSRPPCWVELPPNIFHV
jgi:hypothetical protein